MMSNTGWYLAPSQLSDIMSDAAARLASGKPSFLPPGTSCDSQCGDWHGYVRGCDRLSCVAAAYKSRTDLHVITVQSDPLVPVTESRRAQ